MWWGFSASNSKGGAGGGILVGWSSTWSLVTFEEETVTPAGLQMQKKGSQGVAVVERRLAGAGSRRWGRNARILFFFLSNLQPMPCTGQTYLQARGQGCLVKHLLLKQARKGRGQHEGTSGELTTPGVWGFIRGIFLIFSTWFLGVWGFCNLWTFESISTHKWTWGSFRIFTPITHNSHWGVSRKGWGTEDHVWGSLNDSMGVKLRD